MNPLPIDKVHRHKQLYGYSCIPSAVEMVLKQTGRVGEDYYDLQEEWGDNRTRSFDFFDRKELCGVEFSRKFNNERGPGFPLSELIATVREELMNGRYVVTALLSSPGEFHAYLIYEVHNETFRAVSKKCQQPGYQQAYDFFYGLDTLYEDDLLEEVRRIQGTDILIYHELSR